MSTTFLVSFVGGGEPFTVGVDKDDYLGTAVVLVESLIRTKGMTHQEAITFYSTGKKHISADTLTMDGVSVVRVNEDSAFTYPDTDHEFTFSAPTDTEEYWGDWGMH